MSLDGNTFPNNEAYLKDYEEKIRQLPYEELNDILDVIDRNPVSRDKSPERINIVKKRMAELEPIVCQEEERKAKLHEELEKKYKENHSIIFGVLFFAFLIVGINCIAIEQTEASTFCLAFASLFLGIEGYVDKRLGHIYKEESPIAFKITLTVYFTLSAILFIYGIYSLIF